MNQKNLGYGLMCSPLTDPADTAKIDYGQVCKMANRYLGAGFNYLDTAAFYHNFGNSDVAFQKCVAKRHPRDSYTLTDKHCSLFNWQTTQNYVLKTMQSVELNMPF